MVGGAEGAAAGAMGAFVAETFADILSPEKPFEKIKALEAQKGRKLTAAEFTDYYNQTLVDYDRQVKSTVNWAKIVAATTTMLAGQDVVTATNTATLALENNYLQLAYYGLIAAGLAYSAYEVHHAYKTGGAEAALKTLEIEVAFMAVGGAVGRVAGKAIGYSVGKIVYPTIEAALEVVFTKNPGLKLALGSLTEKLIAAGNKLNNTALARGITRTEEALAKVHSAAARKFGLGGNQAPYNPRAMETMLAENNPGQTVTSGTLPKPNQPNVKLAGSGLTLSGTDIHVPFDIRGFPIFDKYIKFETRLPVSIVQADRKTHMRQATRNLRSEIEGGTVNSSLFSTDQLNAIKAGKSKIPDLTWHHHQETGRMQLIPQDIHKLAHVGGVEMW